MNNSDRIYNVLCLSFFQEESMLNDRVAEARRNIVNHGYRSDDMIDFIEAVAVRDYVLSRTPELLRYIGHFRG